MGLNSGPLRADLMATYSLEKSIICQNSNTTLIEVTCVVYLPLLVGIHHDKYNNQRVPKYLAIVKALGKCITNPRKVDALPLLINLINIPEMLLVVRAMDIVTPHLGRNENFLIVSKRKRILGFWLKNVVVSSGILEKN